MSYEQQKLVTWQFRVKVFYAYIKALFYATSTINFYQFDGFVKGWTEQLC